MCIISSMWDFQIKQVFRLGSKCFNWLQHLQPLIRFGESFIVSF